MRKTPEAREIREVKIVVNPNSTRYKRGHLFYPIESIEQAYPNRNEKIRTTGNPEEDAINLKKVLRLGDVVVGACGDGGIHQIINTLQDEDIRDLQIPLLPIWGGNGNNLATMLNGRSNHFGVVDILRYGKLAKYRTLNVHETPLDSPTTVHKGGMYTGYGVSGDMATKLNSSPHRNRTFYKYAATRLALEGQALRRSLHARQPFHLSLIESSQLPPGPNEQLRTVLPLPESLTELSVIKGRKMAKFLHMPVELQEERALVTYFEEQENDKRSFALGKFVSERIMGLSDSKDQYITDDSVMAFRVESPTTAHIDAEEIELQAGTAVMVELGDDLYVISNKLEGCEAA